MLFHEFREAFLRAVLDLLWGQWCVLGVAGHSKNLRGDCIDPEALILSSCYFGRFDQRLFDGMLEWLTNHEDLVSSQRLSSLVKKEFPESAGVVKAIATFLFSQEKKFKWRRLAGDPQPGIKADPFFFYPSGSPVEIFGHQDPSFLSIGFSRGSIEKKSFVGSFRWAHPASLWLRLRAFMGVSSRTDVFVYLMTHQDGGHPSHIARVMGYTQRGIQQALVSMSASGWVLRSERPREVVYTLSESIRNAFIPSGEGHPEWLTWSAFFHGLGVLWKALNDQKLFGASADVQSAVLRDTMLQAAPDLSRLGFSGYFIEVGNRKGEDYIDSLSTAWSLLFGTLQEQ